MAGQHTPPKPYYWGGCIRGASHDIWDSTNNLTSLALVGKREFSMRLSGDPFCDRLN